MHTSHKKQYEELSRDLAVHSKRGLPMIVTGVGFWLVVGLIGNFLPEIAVWAYIYGIGTIFPVGLLVARLMKVNMLAKHNPLSMMAGIVGGMQILFSPVLIFFVVHIGEWIPFAVCVLTGAHFLPFTIIYRSKMYLYQSFATVIVGAVFGNIGDSRKMFEVMPFAIMTVYFITCLGLVRENKDLLGSTNKPMAVFVSGENYINR